MNVEISELIGKKYCISTEDAQKLYEILYQAVAEHKYIEVSFKGIEVIVSVFLNVSIGQLYGKFSQNDISKYIKLINMTPDDNVLLDRVVENALNYYEHAESYDKAWDKAQYDD